MTLPARYPAPHAEEIFSDHAKTRRWAEWTRKFLQLRLDEYYQDPTDHATIVGTLLGEYLATELPTPEAVATKEMSTGHDVVAFLALLTRDMSPALKRHIHYGLTSSDLVENAHHDALRYHARALADELGDLRQALNKHQAQIIRRAGRTHGQIAAPTSWGHQMRVHRAVLLRIETELVDFGASAIVKSVGPTGVSSFRDLGGYVANRHVVPSTQIIPRDYQLAWAALYLRLSCALENLALFVRLGARSGVAEVREGATRVGSSAMPHKQNPIDSEKVCGLARVARGHFLAIAEGVAVWEDRDLTNSSVERIAVPDLAAVVEHMTATMSKVMANLVIDHKQMHHTLQDPRVMTNIMQTLAQDHFELGPIEASEFMRNVADRMDGFDNPAAWVHFAWISAKIAYGEEKATEWYQAVLAQRTALVGE